jgi:hypothetical protein
MLGLCMVLSCPHQLRIRMQYSFLDEADLAVNTNFDTYVGSTACNAVNSVGDSSPTNTKAKVNMAYIIVPVVAVAFLLMLAYPFSSENVPAVDLDELSLDRAESHYYPYSLVQDQGAFVAGNGADIVDYYGTERDLW